MTPQVRAILRAQWQMYRNQLRLGRAGVGIMGVFLLLWYGFWTVFAVMSAKAIATLSTAELQQTLTPALLGIMAYWQVVPLLLVSTGMSLDLRKLLPYPIAPSQLFWLELVLRVTSGVEAMIVTLGIGAGILLNGRVPAWAALFLLPFLAMNLFLSAGLRDLFQRIFARRGWREFAVLLFLVVIALPSLVMVRGTPERLREAYQIVPNPAWPWSAAARLLSGHFDWLAGAVLLAWLLASYAFGRWQFARNLRFDMLAAAATSVKSKQRGGLGRLLQLPSRLFSDPLGALVEKELRSLSRAARFRVLFLMGPTFGVMIFLPSAFQHRGATGFFAENFLAFTSIYALLLLGEMVFWNQFGIDRSAAQAYFVMPVPFTTVLVSKNIAALTFAVLDLLLIAVACWALRVPVDLLSVGEALGVVLTASLLLVAAGNLTSVLQPRAVDPSQAMRASGAGKVQFLLLLAYPVVLVPVGLAYGARYAFDSEWAFFGVILIDVVFACIVYRIALESAVAKAESGREMMLEALSRGGGMVGS